MKKTFVVRTHEGERTYTGRVSSRSPHTVVLMLTEPFAAAGRMVRIPTADILSEQSDAA